MRASTGTSVCCLVSTLARTMALSPSSFSSVNRSRSPPKRSIFEMYVCSSSSAKRCTNSSRCGGPGGPRLTDDRLQVGEDFALELVEALAEDVAEVAVPVLAALERLEVVDHARKAVALDQVIRHQERQLIGRQRAFLEVAHREAARVAERLEIQLGGHERRVVADPGGGEPAPVGQRVEAEALERREGHPLGHALGQPLLGAPLALRHLDLRDVRELVRDETQPLAAARLRAVVVEQELAALADADRELRKLGGARRRDLRVVHETVLERLAPAIHVEREGRGHRQPQLADQDRRQPAHGGFVVAERARVARDRDGGGIDGEWNHNAAGATGCDDDQRQQRGDAKAAVGNPFHTPRHFHTPARSKGRTFPSSGCETYNATPSHGCAAGGGGRAQTRTCSGRTPRPMSRPGRRRSRGKRASSRTAGGGRRGRRRRSTRRTIRFWTSTWTRWVTRVGHSRRRCTRARSSALTRPSRSGAASRLAAATASWIARLMPTPPTGDIACGASPRQSTPGPNQRARRSTRTVSSFTSSQSRSALASARASASRATSSRNAARPRARISSSVPLAITKPHCQ